MTWRYFHLIIKACVKRPSTSHHKPFLVKLMALNSLPLHVSSSQTSQVPGFLAHSLLKLASRDLSPPFSPSRDLIALWSTNQAPQLPSELVHFHHTQRQLNPHIQGCHPHCVYTAPSSPTFSNLLFRMQTRSLYALHSSTLFYSYHHLRMCVYTHMSYVITHTHTQV